MHRSAWDNAWEVNLQKAFLATAATKIVLRTIAEAKPEVPRLPLICVLAAVGALDRPALESWQGRVGDMARDFLGTPAPPCYI